jgi:hypothetical protein
MSRRQFLNTLGLTVGSGLIARSKILGATSEPDIANNHI